MKSAPWSRVTASTSVIPDRRASIVHAVADDLGQAIEDITHDWSLDRNQQWITRTATAVGVDPASRSLSEDPNARRARLLAELEPLERHGPPDVTAELAAARADLDRIRRSRDDLVRGAGRWHHTPLAAPRAISTKPAASVGTPSIGWTSPTPRGASDIGGVASPSRPVGMRLGPSGTGSLTGIRPSSSSTAGSPEPSIALLNSRPMPGSVSNGWLSTSCSTGASNTNESFDDSTTQ